MTGYKSSKHISVSLKGSPAPGRLFERVGNWAEGDPDGERRRSPRVRTNIVGLLQVLKFNGEVLVLPVTVKNLSKQGMLLELRDKGHFFLGMIDQIETLSVMLEVEGEPPVSLECQPRHIVIEDDVELGVEMSEEFEDRLPFLRFIM